jgi:hypothetical protein
MTARTLPIGAYLAAALAAANIPCDSGEDVDRLLSELAARGYVLHDWQAERAEPDAIEAEAVQAERERLLPTGDELDDLLADISGAAYASEARQWVEDFFERKWGLRSPITVEHAALLADQPGRSE